MRSAMKVSIGVICAVVFVGFGPTASARADICGDTANPPADTNGAWVNACDVGMNGLFDGDLFASGDLDFYRFTVPGPMRLSVALQNRSSPSECVNGRLYNGAGMFVNSGQNCGIGAQPPTQISADIPAAGPHYLIIDQPTARQQAPNRYQFQITGTDIPAVPTNVYAAPVNATTISVEWLANSTNQTRFDVEGNGAVHTANSSPYAWTGLTGGTKVCFRVRAVNAVGPSAWYPTVSPSDICATTPNAATGVVGSSGGVRPAPTSVVPPPPPPLTNLPPAPPPTTVVVVPGAPGQPAPVGASPATPRGPSAACVRARADVRRLRGVVSNDRDRLGAASTRRSRKRLRNKLNAHRDRLVQARRRVTRNC